MKFVSEFSLKIKLLAATFTYYISDDHPLRSLRLLCMLSITTDGVTQSELQSIKTSHLHAHGYRHIPLMYKLETAGLLRRRKENILRSKLPNWSSEWTSNAHRLKLLPTQSKRSEQKTTPCPSYVFSAAYTPVIVRNSSQIITKIAHLQNFSK